LGEQAVQLNAEAKRAYHVLRARGDSAEDAHFAIGEAAHACFAEHMATFTTFGVSRDPRERGAGSIGDVASSSSPKLAAQPPRHSWTIGRP
jgi:hypothetical protein